MLRRGKKLRLLTGSYFQPALLQLLQAYECAKHFDQPIWEFAVKIEALRHAGLDHADLRGLLWLAGSRGGNPPGQGEEAPVPKEFKD
jgi:hypothetical protein